MRVVFASDDNRTEWDDYARKHSDSLAYHQYAWKKAVEKAYGFRGVYLIAREGSRVRGILPLIDFRLPVLGSTLISLPYCDVGGPLADSMEVENALQEKALELTVERNAGGLELRCGVNRSGVSETVRVDKVRMVLELPGESQVLFSSFKAKLRSQISKPVRDGLRVRVGGLELAGEFYTVFAENMRDLGSPVHSRRWIYAVLSEYAERARVGAVYTANGEIAAAGIILFNDRVVSVPWASSLRRFNRLNPNMLLYWSFLRFAADNGFRQFDFGRSTPGKGTYRFKEQWGARPRPLHWHDPFRSNFIEKGSIREYIRRSVESIWKRLPLGFCNLVGPGIRRFISL